MSSFSDSDSSSILSKQTPPAKAKKPKLTMRLGLILLAVGLVFGLFTLGSRFDPSSTLAIPHRELHPQSIKKLGLITPDDPFHPYYSADEKNIQKLMRNLRKAIPLSSSDQASLALENQKILYVTLHREASKYYGEEDYALTFYPEISVVYFGQQYFQINEATGSSFSQIINEMNPGWW